MPVRDAAHDLARRIGRQGALLDLALEIAPDGRRRLLQRGGRAVDQRHVPAMLGEHVGDPVAHGAGSHHRGPLHDGSPVAPSGAVTSERER